MSQIISYKILYPHFSECITKLSSCFAHVRIIFSEAPAVYQPSFQALPHRSITHCGSCMLKPVLALKFRPCGSSLGYFFSVYATDLHSAVIMLNQLQSKLPAGHTHFQPSSLCTHLQPSSSPALAVLSIKSLPACSLSWAPISQSSVCLCSPSSFLFCNKHFKHITVYNCPPYFFWDKTIKTNTL